MSEIFNNTISLVIPDTENILYLKRCLGSLTRQSFKEFEVFIPSENISEEIRSISEELDGKLNINFRYSTLDDIVNNVSGKYILFISSTSVISALFLENMLDMKNESADIFPISNAVLLGSSVSESHTLFTTFYGKLYNAEIFKSEYTSLNYNDIIGVFLFNMRYAGHSEEVVKENSIIYIYESEHHKILPDFNDYKSEYGQEYIDEFLDNDEKISEIMKAENKCFRYKTDYSEFVSLANFIISNSKLQKEDIFRITSLWLDSSIESGNLTVFKAILTQNFYPQYAQFITAEEISDYDNRCYEYLKKIAGNIVSANKTEYIEVFKNIFNLTSEKLNFMLQCTLRDFCTNISMMDIVLNEINNNNQQVLEEIKNLNEVLNELIEENNNLKGTLKKISVNSPARMLPPDYTMDGVVSSFANGKLGMKAALKSVMACLKHKFSGRH